MYYSQADSTILEGLSFAFQNTGVSPLNIGSLPISGQQKYSKSYLPSDQYQFFGFKTTTNDATFVLENVEIVEYDKVQFDAYKTTIQQAPAQIAAQNTLI